MTITDELLQTLNQLDTEQQQLLLNFARVLVKTPKAKGEKGISIVQATGYFDPEALDEMEAAINEANGIDWRGWE